MRSVYLITLLFSVSACLEQEPIVPSATNLNVKGKSYPGVEAKLWSHFSSFEQEAFVRGVTIDLSKSGITGQFTDIIGPEAAHCNHTENNHGNIVINSSEWSKWTDLTQEAIVFHELGHCFLNRDHDNSANPFGECISIMNDGKQKLCIWSYREDNREQYLNELFK